MTEEGTPYFSQWILISFSSDLNSESPVMSSAFFSFASADKQWLHFAFDDNRHRAVHYSAKLPPLPLNITK